MRRRILLAILGTVALSLVLSGVGTYVLLRREANRNTEAALRAEVESLVGVVDVANTSRAPVLGTQKLLKGLRLEGISVVVVGPGGNLRGTLPDGVSTDDVSPATVVPGTTISGPRAGLYWAASTVDGPRGSTISVVITRRPEQPDAPVAWYLIAGGIALAVGAGVAAWLSDTLTRPLRNAQAATLQIAGGDLSTRLPEPSEGDHDEVAELTRAINHMAASMAQSRGLERQFLMSVSHDLRTPLTSIGGYADAIADGTASDPTAAAGVIAGEAQRLGRLVGDLLDLARLDAHEFSFALRPVPAAEVATETAEGLRPAAEAAGIALTVRDAGLGPPSLVDPDRLAQAVANLVENALKYATGNVWVDTHPGPDGSAAIHVTDDGPGIAPAELDQVFERLYTADRQPAPGRRVGGSGLGLAIVRQLVEGMGGSVRAESPALGEGPTACGARFVVSLPTAR
ncbi:MAG: HAMP domain-containing sensor histidine kinase [Acidimicrobiales bacterium]